MTYHREFISPVQRGKLPSFVRSEYPAFEEYLMNYFQWLEQDDGFLEVLENWKHNTDASNEVEPYVTAILHDLGWTWSGQIKVPKMVLLATLRDFYLSRGTKKSFQWLFSTLFDEKIDIQYPRERMLVPSYANYAEESQIYCTAVNRDSPQFQAILQDLASGVHVKMTGLASGTVATVETMQILLVGNSVYLNAYIIAPLTEFIVKEDVRIESESGFVVESLHNILQITVTNPGSGHAVNDDLVVSGAGLNGVMRVSDLNGGKIDALTIVDGGSGYKVDDQVVTEKQADQNGFGFYGYVSAVDGSGKITAIKVTDRGRGFDTMPKIYVKSWSGTGAVLQGSSSTIGAINRFKYIQPFVDFNPASVLVSLGNASFQVQEGTIFKSRVYKDRLGVLGENTVLIDSDRYQQFSYDLASQVPAKFHKDIVDELLHPVGYIRTSVLRIEESGEETIQEQTLEEIDQVEALTYIVTLAGDPLVTQAGDYLTTVD